MDREDGLPNPTTVTDLYLAAVLDELRALRKERPQTPHFDGKNLAVGAVRVRERKEK